MQYRVTTGGLGERRRPMVVHRVDPLFLQRANMFVVCAGDSSISEPREETARLTVFLIGEFLVDVVSRGIRMKLGANIRNVFLGETRGSKPIKSPQWLELGFLEMTAPSM